MPTERRLAAIMFTDIVGYTALMAADESSGHRVRARQGEILRPLVEQYAGEWISHVGDETLSSFPSAVDAVNCALAIQVALQDESELRLRIGIHVGDVVVSEGSVHGDGVNIASRIRPLAQPGGICVSDEVQHAVLNQPTIETRFLGEQKLKNVPRAVSVFAVTGTPGKPSGPGPKRPAEPGRDPIQSLAVLPLENLSGDPDQEYFADGMTEALIGDLAKIAALRVISRTSVMQYKRERKPLPEIARELNVDAVVEGTVMRAGDRVRITAQLIDARADAHLWSDRYDRELRDVLALQGEVARAVAREVEAELTPGEQSRLHATRALDPAAHDAYLRGLQHTSAFTPADARLAVAHYEKAIALDPEFAEAYVSLAYTNHMLGYGLFTDRDPAAQPKASAAAHRAVELAPDLGAAQTMLGLVRLYDWDWAGAREVLKLGVELSPSDPLVLFSYGEFLAYLGEHEEALQYARRAVNVAPLDPFFRFGYGHLLFYARDYARAIAVLKEVIELQADYAIAWMELAAIYAQLEDSEKASAATLHYLVGVGANEHASANRRGYRGAGAEGATRAWRDAMIDQARSQPVSGVAIATLAVLTEDTDLAFTWLDRAARDRDPALRTVNVLPLLDPIRSDPRFTDLLRRIRFPEVS